MPCGPVPDNLVPSVNDNASLWRYLDLPRMLSMLENSSLYFCRADLFEDKWEGAYPQCHLLTVMDALTAAEASNEEIDKRLEFYIETQPRMAYLNCWHMSKVESAAMWQLYSSGGESIAIRTTAKRLSAVLNSNPTQIFLGKVTYCNYFTSGKYWGRGGLEVNNFLPHFAKRPSFAHEKETRAVIYAKGDSKDSAPGINIEVNLPELIQTVYVSPKSPSWFQDVVRGVLTKYGLSKVEIVHSPLYEPSQLRARSEADADKGMESLELPKPNR